MKTILNIALAVTLISVGEVSFAQSNSQQTEEYAIISVFQRGRRNYINTTIGSVSSKEKEYKRNRDEKRFDLTPVVAEMEMLNKMGYELFDSSTAMEAMFEGRGGHPFYVFIFKKKKD